MGTGGQKMTYVELGRVNWAGGLPRGLERSQEELRDHRAAMSLKEGAEVQARHGEEEGNAVVCME